MQEQFSKEKIITFKKILTQLMPYKSEINLSENEKQALMTWISQGMPQ